jgi:DHA1 family multidrug resistance protein-like MFS transporter
VELGVGDTRIGMLVFAYSLAAFLANVFFGRASDIHGRRMFIWSGLAASCAAFMLLIFATDFWTLLLARTLTGLCIGIYPSALVAYTIESRQRLSRFASFGSVGWGLGVLITGFAAQMMGVRWVFILASMFFAVAFVVALRLTPVDFRSISIPLFPKAIIKRNRALYASIIIRHSGAVMIWTFWPLFMMYELGLDLFEIAIIQATNMISQFFIMFLLGDRLHCRSSVILGFLLSIVTFVCLSLSRNFWELWLVQFILAAAWAFIYTGGLRMLDEMNVEKATSNGLFTSAIALSAIIGPLMATALIQFTDYRGIMLVAAAAAVAGTLAFIMLDGDGERLRCGGEQQKAEPGRAAAGKCGGKTRKPEKTRAGAKRSRVRRSRPPSSKNR